MPTFERSTQFDHDYQKLTAEQKAQFRRAIAEFIPAVRNQQFSPKLRIKRVQGLKGVWEMSWAADGRATFEYGDQLQPGEPHVLWRRVGTHKIFHDA